MMTFVRKHAPLFALLAVAAGFIAAPYLIPENPDSGVFRHGTLSMILLLACCQPLAYALKHADCRTLICSFVFGLLLGTAMSLGAELRFYGMLLPGTGSMIRRLAVPLLSAPLLGGLSARIMLFSPSGKKSLRLHPGVYTVILLLCWLPLFIAYYPGMFNYDFHTEYQQFLDGTWDARHPLLYLVVTYAFYGLGSALGIPSLGILLTSVIRMVVFAAALSCSCVFIQRRKAPVWVSVLLLAAYALLPVFSVMAVSSAKDTPFSSALLVLSLLAWTLIEDPETFFSRKRRPAAFIIMTVLTFHLRKNGVSVLLMLILLALFTRSCRKQTVIMCASGALACVMLNIGLNAALQPVEQPSFQTYSLPAQQLVRAYHVGDMTEEEKAELRSWYVDPNWGLQLLPHLADAAKGSLNPQKLEASGSDFINLWSRVGQRNLRVYAEAFLMLNMGAWYPDDVSHATVYQPYGLDKGYLQTDEYDLSSYGIVKPNLLPSLRQFCEQICRQNTYMKYPVISQLLCTSAPLWMIFFSCAMLIARKKTRFLPAASGVLALWLSYLLGPCTLARYMLPLFCFAPVLLMIALLDSEPEKN